MTIQYANSHIVRNDPDKNEVYTRINYIIFGKWVNFELGRKRQIDGVVSIQVMTIVIRIDNKPLLVDINLN